MRSRNYSRRKSPVSSAKYYKDLDDLPWSVFCRVLEKGQKEKLCYEGDPDLIQCGLAWDKIYNEYLDDFGRTPEWNTWLDKRVELYERRVDFLENQDRKQLFFIRQLENEINEMEKSGENVTFMSIVVGLELNHPGIKIMENDSARKALTYIKELKESGRKQAFF